ncbi:hypothetical protein LPB140_01070 [Sphingorhabdus lutea]|uniref:FAD-binding PCMH-type domain-containing protein n=1 Tax=Sphingorhabdus lutea TaxID=1913578 RepID=A0A1L3J966_9SPHN|nr:FAD-binding oxidoreductase [Sphingorhabdus lutea]APG61660.1 hypothetical protein LPB140_01070 [Sphingorhabdus lutea]
MKIGHNMTTNIRNSLSNALYDSGVEVKNDAASLQFFAHDICDCGGELAAIITPKNIDELAKAVKAAHNEGAYIVPRGGGMSYTGGYTPKADGAVMVDLSQMDRILEIDEEDMTVTVEAGCTWAILYEALKPLGLRTPFWGTLSGLKASIGGGMSQNAIFWGTGRYGSAVNSCISMQVVLANGDILQTGNGKARPYGPDLTGIFLADTGALAIKAAITLRLIKEAKAHGFASFTFDHHHQFLAAMSDIIRADISTECFGFDPRLNAIRMQRDSLSSDVKALAGMMKAQKSIFGALKEGAKVIAAGRNFLKDAQFSMHVLAEGRIQAAADADIAAARAIAQKYGGAEVENSIPKIIRANPFGPLNSILGPQGERWLPIHGLLPHSRAKPCYDAIEEFFSQNSAEMEKFGIYYGTLIAAVGGINGAGVVIEPCLYWPDERNPLIEKTVESDHLSKLPTWPHDDEIWNIVKKYKQAIIDIFAAHGASHFQIGRAYPYVKSLDAPALALLQSIKQHVDSHGKMNPGSLGLNDGK